jgi:hypothetical protein
MPRRDLCRIRVCSAVSSSRYFPDGWLSRHMHGMSMVFPFPDKYKKAAYREAHHGMFCIIDELE